MELLDQVPASVWWWLGGLSLAMALLSPLLVGALLVAMPADYFVRAPRRRDHDGRLIVRLLVKLLKNLLGAVLLLAGIVMIATPGQGVLAMLVGVSLLDVPGKRKVECYLASLPRVYRAINRLRQKFGRPPYELPRDEAPKPRATRHSARPRD